MNLDSNTWRFPSLIYLTLVFFTLVDEFLSLMFMPLITMFLIIIFLISEFQKSPKMAKVNGVIFACLGVSAAWYGNNVEAIIEGFDRSKMFLVMFFAVSWLQLPARESPSLSHAREIITSQPQGRRFIFIVLGVHGLGSVLNLAGLSLIASIIDKSRDFVLKRRFTTALMLGFTSASCWSPFYISVAVVLIAIPSLKLFDVALFGIIISSSIMCVGFAYDFLKFKKNDSFKLKPPKSFNIKKFIRLILILMILILLVASLHYFGDLAIPIALGIVTPVFSIVWWIMLAPKKSDWHKRGGKFVGKVISELENLRGEALVFVAATIFGVGVSSLVPDHIINQTLDNFIPYLEVRILILMFGTIFLGLLGVHPVVSVILIGESVSPEILGVADWVMALTLLSVWGLSTMVNPYSATTLYLSKVTSISPFVIAWQWNLPICLLANTVASLLVIMFMHHQS